jgi:cytoplasmic iron level regulating protein YaaA (DUF328/UPF0246 family)
MIILLSPAKTLDFETPAESSVCTQADFLSLSQDLINGLAKLSAIEVGKLMGISSKLANLNQSRYQEWSKRHTEKNGKQAVLAFKGDVYEGLQAWNLKKGDFSFAQKHLRILSGLYGILRPLDLIQAHRLEMGTVYANPAGKDLYDFWGDRLAKSINQDLSKSKSKLLVNLASQEYFKAAKEKDISADIISPVFKDEKNGNLKIISFYAKKARGYMSSFLIRNRIKDMEGLKQFSEEGYHLDPDQSTDSKPVFIRTEENRIAV